MAAEPNALSFYTALRIVLLLVINSRSVILKSVSSQVSGAVKLGSRLGIKNVGRSRRINKSDPFHSRDGVGIL